MRQIQFQTQYLGNTVLPDR